jgi:PAS domain S-box-containing protein
MKADAVKTPPAAGGEARGMERITRDYAEMQARLAKIAAIAPAAIHEFRLSPDGRMTMPFATEAIRDIYGVPEEDLARDFSIGLELIHPDDLARVGEAVEKSRRTLTPFHEEWRVRNPKRGEIWIECRSTPEPQPDGSMVWYGYLHDITERKRAAELLHLREREFRTLAENSPDIIIRYDREGRRIYVNPAYEREFGVPAIEALNKSLDEHWLLDTPAGEYKARLREVLETGRPTDVELVSHHADGRLVTQEVRIVPERDTSGRVVGALAMGRNITALKEAVAEARRNAEEIHRREQEFRTLAENSPDIILRYDRDCRRIYVNPAYERDFSVSAANVLGKRPDADWRLDTPVTEYMACLRLAIQEGEASNIELVSQRAGGRRSTYEVRIVPERDAGGEIVGALAIGRNISALKETEAEIRRLNSELEHRVEIRTRELAAERTKLEAANKELEAFSYSVSHDLRAPLRSIDGFSRILLEDYADKLDEEGRENLETVRAASQRMALLIDDMLQLSRITRSEMRRERVDLSAIVREIAAELQRTEPERRVEIVIQPDLFASADGRLVRIVLENLLGNAWKFTGREPEARIEVGRARVPDGPAFFVRDNGVGFDMTYVHKLFGAFQRLHTTAEFPGTGVGLATVQRVVHRHGGRVWADGRPGRGAAFYFTLPEEASS